MDDKEYQRIKDLYNNAGGVAGQNMPSADFTYAPVSNDYVARYMDYIDKQNELSKNFNVGRSLYNGSVVQLGRGIQSTLEAAVETNYQRIKAGNPDYQENEYAKATRSMIDSMKKSSWIQRYEVRAENDVQRFTYALAEGAGQLISQAIIAKLTGGIGSSITMGASIFGNQYADLREQGVDPVTAAKAGVVNAAIQMPLEQLSLNKMFKAIPIKNTTTRKMFMGMFERGATEFATEFVQQYPEELTTLWALNKDLSTDELIDLAASKQGEMFINALESGVIGAILGTGAGALNIGFQKVGHSSNIDNIRETARLANEKGINVQDIAGPINANAGGERLEVDAGALLQYFQESSNAQEVAEILGITEDEVKAAAAKGETVDIMRGEYTAMQVKDNSFVDKVAAYTMFEDSGYTPANEERRKKLAEQYYQQAKEYARIEDAFTSQLDDIHSQMIRGGAQKQVANYYRTLISAYARAQNPYDPTKTLLKHPIVFAGTDENGKPLFQTGIDTTTENFKAWFKGSKVVDEKGRPLVMYHGTGTPGITVFDKKKAQDKAGRQMAMGQGKGKFYFATTQMAAEVAASGAVQRGQGKTAAVMPVYLSLQNPITLEQYKQQYQALSGHDLNEGYSDTYTMQDRDKAIAKLDKMLQSQGVDGIYDTELGFAAVYDNTAIKHATENNGNYNPNDPNIYHQNAGANAETADLAMLNKAMQMEAEGKDDEEIRKATGWFKGEDGQWRFKIPDNLDDIHLEKLKVQDPNFITSTESTIGELYDNQELMEAYPQLKDVPVYSTPLDADGETQCHIDENGNLVAKIIINQDLIESTNQADIEENKLTLVHEIQHIIQQIEGFATGGNDDMVLEQIKDQWNRNDDVIYAISEKYGTGVANDIQQAAFFTLVDLYEGFDYYDGELDRVKLDAILDPSKRGLETIYQEEKAKVKAEIENTYKAWEEKYKVSKEDVDYMRKMIEHSYALKVARNAHEWGNISLLDLYRALYGEMEARATEYWAKTDTQKARNKKDVELARKFMEDNPEAKAVFESYAEKEYRTLIDERRAISSLQKEAVFGGDLFASPDGKLVIDDHFKKCLKLQNGVKQMLIEKFRPNANDDVSPLSAMVSGKYSTPIIVFDDMVIPKFKQSDTYYQQAEAQAEDKDLVVYQNTFEDGLIRALNSGGMAAPSIAITKKDITFDNFGDITLIGNKELIDPDNNTDVYSRDAYTTRTPTPEFKKATIKALEAFKKKWKAKLSEQAIHDIWHYAGNYPAMFDNVMMSSPYLQYDYITKVLGKKVDPVYVKTEYGREENQLDNGRIGEMVEAIIDKDLSPLEEYEAMVPVFREIYLIQVGEINDKIDLSQKKADEAAYKETRATSEGEATFYRSRKEIFLQYVEQWEKKKVALTAWKDRIIITDENGKKTTNPNIARRLLNDAYNTKQAREHNGEIDYNATAEALQDEYGRRLKNTDYEQFVRDLKEEIVGDPVLKLGSKYVPYTVENITAYMLKQRGAGKEQTAMSDSKMAAIGAKVFKSIQEIKDNKDLLKDQKTVDKLIDELAEQKTKTLALVLGEESTDDIDYGQEEGFNEILASIIKGGKKPTVAKVKKALDAEGLSTSPESIKAVMDIANAYRECAAWYFEAKPQRTVKISEYSGAVVPKGTSANTIQRLQDAGLEVKVYDPFVEGDRQRVTQEAATETNAYFQKAWHGTGAVFDNWDLGYAGTGEGGAAHGWGLYFAQDKDVAIGYRSMLVNKAGGRAEYLYKGKPLQDLYDQLERKRDYDKLAAVEQFMITQNTDDIVNSTDMYEPKTIKWFKEKVMPYLEGGKDSGSLFEVEVPENDVLLDEQKTYAQQPKGVKASIKKLISDLTVEAKDKIKSTYIDNNIRQKSTSDLREKLLAEKAEADKMRRRFFAAGREAPEAPALAKAYAKRLAELSEAGYDVAELRANEEKRAALQKEQEDKIAEIDKKLAEEAKQREQNYQNEKAAANSKSLEEMLDGMNGWDIYAGLYVALGQTPKEASLMLNKYGIKGITYEGGRDGRCFVVFDEKAVSTIERYNQENSAGKSEVIAKFNMLEEQLIKYYDGIKAKLDDEIQKANQLFTDAQEGKITDEQLDKEIDSIKKNVEGYRGKIAEIDEQLKGLKASMDAAIKEAEQKNTSSGKITKGGISWDQQGTAIIALFKGADASTVIHETGHYFVENLIRDVLSGECTELQIKDANALMEYCGITIEAWKGMSFEERRQYHEKLAEAFETYLMEGKAPSKELRSVFKKFADWLKDVYKSLARNQNAVPINDEVRKVFDHMLASEEEIAQMEKVNGYLAKLPNAVTEHLSDRAKKQLEDAIMKAHDDAVELLTKQSLVNFRQDRRKEIEEYRASILPDITEQVENEPLYLAQKDIEDAFAHRNRKAKSIAKKYLDHKELEFENWQAELDYVNVALDEYLKPLYDEMDETGQQGVEIIYRDDYNANDESTMRGYKASRNSEWYRKWYADHGAPPSKADRYQIAYENLTMHYPPYALDSTKYNEINYGNDPHYDEILQDQKDDIDELVDKKKELERDKDKVKLILKKGLDADERALFESIAEGYGFSSGDELAQKIVDAPSLAKEIKNRVNAAVQGKFPDIMAERQMAEEAAREAFYNDESGIVIALEQVLLEEAQAEAIARSNSDAAKQRMADEKQAREAAERKAEQEARAAERKAESEARRAENKAKADERRQRAIILQQLMEIAAKNDIKTVPLNEAMRVQKYITAERNAAAKAAVAASKKDYEAALEHKRVQAYNHAMVRESMKAKQTYEKGSKVIKALAKNLRLKNIDKLHEKWFDEDNYAQAAALFTRLGMPLKGYDPMMRRESLSEYLARMQELYDNVEFADWLLDEQPIGKPSDLSFAQYEDVIDAIRNINAIVRAAKGEDALIKGQDYAETKQQIMDQLVLLEDKWTVDVGEVERANAFDQYIANMQNTDAFFEKIDGWQSDGLFSKMFTDRVADAMDQEFFMMREFQKRLGDARDRWYGVDRGKGVIDKAKYEYAVRQAEKIMDEKNYYDELGCSVDTHILVKMLMYLGSESSSKKLCSNKEGSTYATFFPQSTLWTDDIATTRENLLQFLGNNLTERDVRYAQDMVNAIEMFWDDLASLDRRTKGFRPKKVEAMPAELTLKSGKVITFMGGYVPLIRRHDTGSTYRGSDIVDMSGETRGAGVKTMHTNTGSSKARDASVYPLDLRKGVELGAVQETVHDICFRELVAGYRKLINDQEVYQLMKQKLGLADMSVFEEFLKKVAKPYGDSRNGLADTTMGKAAQWCRARTVNSAIILNFKTMAQNISNVMLYGDSVDGFSHKDVVLAYTQWFNNTSPAEDMGRMEFIKQKSAFMAERMETIDITIRDIQEGTLKVNPMEKMIADVGGKMMVFTDNLSAVPVWYQAYAKKISEGATDREAVMFADKVIRRTLGSSRVTDVAAWQRGGPMAKLFTVFQSFFITQYNQALREGGKDVKLWSEGKKAEAARNAFAYLLSKWLLACLMNVMLGLEDPFEEESKNAVVGKTKITQELIHYPIGMLGPASAFINAGVDKILGISGYGYRGTPIEGMYKNVERSIGKIKKGITNDDYQGALEGVTSTLGLVFGVPSQLNKIFWNGYDAVFNGMELQWGDLYRRRPKKER